MAFKIIEDGNITSVPGFSAGTAHCGLKNSGKPDICIINIPSGAVCSGVFTTNSFRAAPVVIDIELLDNNNNIKAVTVNSGIANACTGEQGLKNARHMQQITADVLGIGIGQVLVASTGVIGKQLPMEKLESGIKRSASAMSDDGGDEAARAIMTTDLAEKKIAVELAADKGRKIIIGGMAKGSGMIKPDMATMLAFIGTDAKVERNTLDSILKQANKTSFNSISVDGCQSTNDSVFLMANGMSGVSIEEKSTDHEMFAEAVSFVMQELAKKIVMDGEGATKFIEITVSGARDDTEAGKAAMTIADSNLFKTAMFGQDLNWGRINAALGASGCDLDPDEVDIFVGGRMIVKNGTGLDVEKKAAKELLKPHHIKISIDLRNGKGSWTVWTSDLSFDYIKINALYHN
jgi:glutamate N-acetyltransferase / amino-acid N-acetyltransferase